MAQSAAVKHDSNAALDESSTDLESGGTTDERRTSTQLDVTKRTFLECEEVSLTIGKSQILSQVSAVFPPGRLIALMGPSGAGKTSLLNVLSGRSHGEVGGQVSLNGRPITRALMRKECKVVPQHDILIPVLTARETLMYTAKLAINGTSNEQEAAVNRVIEMLSLQECADVICGGSELKGLSGGQLKRVSMGMELLSEPSCLLLDEPTSGLDSKVAEDVVDLIKALTAGGRTVICTIHQPSFQVFAKFDWLVMLNKGRIVYNGQVAALSSYLETIGAPCPTFVNPADHFMQLLSGTTSLDGKEIVSSVAEYPAIFAQSEFGTSAQSDIESTIKLRETHVASQEANMRRREGKPDRSTSQRNAHNHISEWTQISVILRRAFKVTIKDKRQLRTRVAQLTFIGLIMGTIYLRMERTQERVQDKLSVLFMLIMFLTMGSIMSTTLTLPDEKAVMIREFMNGYYSAGAYFIGRLSVLLLFQSLYAVIFGTVMYFLLNLANTVQNFFVFLATFALLSINAGVMGFAAGIFFPSTQAAVAAVPMIIMPLTIFSGLFIPLANIPVYWKWMYHLSFFAHALSLLMINEFEGSFLEPCTLEQLQVPGLCPFGLCYGENSTEPEACPGTVVLARYDYDVDRVPVHVGVLFAFVIGVSALGFLALRRLMRKAQ